MKFSEMKYERPDYEQTTARYSELIAELEQAQDPETFKAVFMKINDLDTHITTMSALCMVRYTIDTRDEFYSAENDYWDEYNPLYEVYGNRVSEICLKCPFREELYDLIPEVYFRLAECQVRSFDEKIVPLLQQENKLASEYGRLKANAQIECRGKTYNLSTISELTDSTDRAERKDGWDAVNRFYSDNEAEFDRIYDELVRIRDRIARELGYRNFTELGYQRMQRIDYNQEMVASYRRQILNDIVPLTKALYEKQAERLSVDRLTYYDDNIIYPEGNPKPFGTYDELIEDARKMYHEMSTETGEFIDAMIDNELWDLKSRDGKEMGGYCCSLNEFRVPFVFANFNGTKGDVDVLTHELGHAFQYWCSRNIPVMDVQWPTMESAEIHSMSMEFNAWPWMELFFGADADRYRYSHLEGCLKFLPYGVLIDHFQHEIYDHPEMTPDERKACYRKLEKMYMPHKNYEGAEILEKGAWWFRQGHVFSMPFYYIDYTLAQVCALQFWARNYRKDPEAWKDYLHLCSLGGTLPFTGLVRAANLRVPFEEGCLKDTAEACRDYFRSHQ